MSIAFFFSFPVIEGRQGEWIGRFWGKEGIEELVFEASPLLLLMVEIFSSFLFTAFHTKEGMEGIHREEAVVD